MEDYKEDALRRYLERRGNLLLVAYDGPVVVGTLLATTIQSPYKRQDWLYIDEVDVKPGYRRQGIGRSLMQTALANAKEDGLTEAWLGTDEDNQAANALYKTLGPNEVDKLIGYTYSLQ